MADPDSVVMEEEELIDFLDRSGTGVLSFASDSGEAPYSLPVSYGYSESVGVFYYRLAVPSDGEKMAVLEAPVSFTTYEQTDEGWKSVVATGRLEPVPEDDYESVDVQGMWEVEIPLVEIFDRPTREVTFRYFELVPETLSGRKETRGE